MKKVLIIVVTSLLTCIVLPISAQTSSPFLNANSSLRSFLSPLSVPTNNKQFLFDMVAHVTDTALFTKFSNDTISSDIWWKLYEEMYYAAYDTTIWTDPDSAFKYANFFYRDTVAIGIMAFDFYKLIDSSLNTNTYFDFDTINNSISDKSPRIGYPYLDSGIFSASPLLDNSYYTNAVFRIDPQFIFHDSFNSNLFSNEKELRINFGDGNGWRVIDPSVVTHYTANYSSSGEYILEFEVVDGASGILLSKSKSRIDVITSNKSSSTFIPFEVPGMKLAVYEGCDPLGWENGKIIIFLEGYDLRDAVRSTNTTAQMLYDGNILIDPLANMRNFGYSFVIVDWEKSGIDIRLNALFLVNLIEQLKCRVEGDPQFVIIGQSMGGVIGRLALTYMETPEYLAQNVSMLLEPLLDSYYLAGSPLRTLLQGLPSEWCKTGKKHNTRLLVTWDSPHQGANIPLSIQHAYKGIYGKIFLRHLALKTKQSAVFLSNALEERAAQQLLIYHADYYSQGLPTHSPEYTELFNLLENIGDYPEYAKTVAYSQGSLSGKRQYHAYFETERAPGDKLFDFDHTAYVLVLGIKLKILDMEARVNTNPAYITQQVYNANLTMFEITIEVKWLSIKPESNGFPIISESASVTAWPLCTSSGGYYGNKTKAETPTRDPYKTNSWILPWDFRGVINYGNGCYGLSTRIGWAGLASAQTDFSLCSDGGQFCFVPIQSALDYRELGSVPLGYNIEADAMPIKVTHMKTDVIVGYADDGTPDDINLNLNHAGYTKYAGYRSVDITNIDNSNYDYYNCSGISNQTRGLLNLEIGDEELYLENNTLITSSVFQTEYDIHVNVENNYYQYSGNPAPFAVLGFYSKSDDYIISPTGSATFLVNNTAPGIGLDYQAPFTGTYQVTNTIAQNCCNIYAILFEGKSAPPNEMHTIIIKDDETFFSIFPNPNRGKSLWVRFKFKTTGKHQLD